QTYVIRNELPLSGLTRMGMVEVATSIGVRIATEPSPPPEGAQKVTTERERRLMITRVIPWMMASWLRNKLAHIRWTAAAAVAMILLSALATALDAQVRVRGYYRKDGTYVRPHVRTYPDGN